MDGPKVTRQLPTKRITSKQLSTTPPGLCYNGDLDWIKEGTLIHVWKSILSLAYLCLTLR